ncbi:MAG: hypothetical protein H6512_01115 [Acidimicrobiia bacterium]|nr:hypothetical protein [Acidimicrobiia bacterium]
MGFCTGPVGAGGACVLASSAVVSLTARLGGVGVVGEVTRCVLDAVGPGGAVGDGDTPLALSLTVSFGRVKPLVWGVWPFGAANGVGGVGTGNGMPNIGDALPSVAGFAAGPEPLMRFAVSALSAEVVPVAPSGAAEAGPADGWPKGSVSGLVASLLLCPLAEGAESVC